MANPIISDNISTQQAIKSRNIDASTARRDKPDAGATRVAGGEESADVGRASQRLAQEIDAVRDPAITSMEQARAQIAQLQLQIAAEPGAVLSAHGRVDPDLVQAAAARPTA